MASYWGEEEQEDRDDGYDYNNKDTDEEQRGTSPETNDRKGKEPSGREQQSEKQDDDNGNIRGKSFCCDGHSGFFS